MFSLVRGLVVLGKSSSEMLFQDVRQTAEYHAICRRVLSLRGLLRRGATEPVREMRRAEARFIAGDKALIVQLCAEVLGVDVRGHLPWVSRCAQVTPGEFLHSDWFGTGNLDRVLKYFLTAMVGKKLVASFFVDLAIRVLGDASHEN